MKLIYLFSYVLLDLPLNHATAYVIRCLWLNHGLMSGLVSFDCGICSIYNGVPPIGVILKSIFWGLLRGTRGELPLKYIGVPPQNFVVKPLDHPKEPLMRPLLTLALVSLLVTACTASKEQYTAGHVGCPSEEVTVVSETGGWMANSWIAQCRGKTFHCVYMTGGRVSCAEELPK